MQVFDFDIFVNNASGQALSVGDPQPLLHQVELQAEDLRQHWLRTVEFGPGPILSRTFSYAIDVKQAWFGDGGRVQQHPPNGQPNQQWTVRHLTSDPNSDPRIIECTDPNPRADQAKYAIEAPDGEGNVDPVIRRTNESPNQQWTFAPGEHTVAGFKIQSFLSEKVLDVPDGAQGPGVTIQQFQDGGARCFNQFWELLNRDKSPIENIGDISSGANVRIRSVCNGLFLQPKTVGENMAALIQASDSDADDQVWQLVGTNAGWKIQPVLSLDLALDLPLGDGDTNNNVPIQVFHDNGGNNQLWIFL